MFWLYQSDIGKMRYWMCRFLCLLLVGKAWIEKGGQLGYGNASLLSFHLTPEPFPFILNNLSGNVFASAKRLKNIIFSQYFPPPKKQKPRLKITTKPPTKFHFAIAIPNTYFFLIIHCRFSHISHYRFNSFEF